MRYHLSQPSSRNDVAGVYKTIQMAGRLLYRFSHIIVAIEIEDVGNQVEGILIVLNFRVKAS
jgi:hypothetical protein